MFYASSALRTRRIENVMFLVRKRIFATTRTDKLVRSVRSWSVARQNCRDYSYISIISSWNQNIRP